MRRLWRSLPPCGGGTGRGSSQAHAQVVTPSPTLPASGEGSASCVWHRIRLATHERPALARARRSLGFMLEHDLYPKTGIHPRVEARGQAFFGIMLCASVPVAVTVIVRVVADVHVVVAVIDIARAVIGRSERHAGKQWGPEEAPVVPESIPGKGEVAARPRATRPCTAAPRATPAAPARTGKRGARARPAGTAAPAAASHGVGAAAAAHREPVAAAVPAVPAPGGGVVNRHRCKQHRSSADHQHLFHGCYSFQRSSPAGAQGSARRGACNTTRWEPRP